MVDATIIVAAWCASDRLPAAVDSALAQTGVNVEVIVVDDASPDDTRTVADALSRKDPRVRVLSRKVNGGPGAARNMGFEAARGRWVAVLDSDDTMVPDRLETMIALGEEKEADALYDDFRPTDESGSPTGNSHLEPLGLVAPRRWDLETFLAGCQAESGRPSLGYLKPVIRRAFLDRHDLRYDETLRNGEDFHLMAELLARDGILWVTPSVGYHYTTRTGSISNRLNPDHARTLAAADSAFLARHRGSLTSRAVALMQRRQRRLGNLASAEAFLGALRDRQFGQAARALIKRPRALGRVLKQGWAAARRRLS